MAGDGTFPGSTTFPGEAVFPGSPDLFLFLTPTRTMQYILEGHLRGVMELGLNVRQAPDGTWHDEFYTEVEDLDAALAFFAGGQRHTVGFSQRNALVDAGYGDRITALPAEGS